MKLINCGKSCRKMPIHKSLWLNAFKNSLKLFIQKPQIANVRKKVVKSFY